jgi:SAM-dependent methyltransferase
VREGLAWRIEQLRFDSLTMRCMYLGSKWPRLFSRSVELEKCLMAGEGGLDCLQFAEQIGDLPRASKTIPNSPHYRLLREYQQHGDQLLDADRLAQTEYVANAKLCMQIDGNYFGATSLTGLLDQARSFIALYNAIRMNREFPCTPNYDRWHSVAGTLPVVRATLTDGVVQVRDGQHRLAIEYALGRKVARVMCLPAKASPLQTLVLSVSQTSGRRELYQEVNSVEFDESWHVVRRCSSRMEMMLKLFKDEGMDPSELSVLDLPCSYGWFVAEYGRLGAKALGVERDPVAAKIGAIAYGITPQQVEISDIESFLASNTRRFDVVMFLSILHHYVLGLQKLTAKEILSRIDRITGRCLILDSGESHEEWYAKDMPEWNPEYIAEFIRQNTSFRRVIALGKDQDNRGIYKQNYGRTLFACFR